MNRSFLAAIALGLTTALSFAQGSPIDGASNPDTGASNAAQQQQINFSRDVLAKMGVDQHYGAQVPGDVPFNDEHGNAIKFGDLYGSRPLIVMPMFFLCQGVCSVETDSLLQNIIQMDDLTVGKDYDVILLSINPKETPELILPRWKSTVKMYGRTDSEKGFHFLSGTYENIRKITDALGFRWVYDPKEGTINHPAGLMLLSPEGKITGYMINKEFPRAFLSHMITDAKASKISPKTDTVLFGCIMIDHATGRRSLVIENVIRLCAAIFAVGVACWIVGMSVSGKSRKAKGGLA
ncbi:MAG TPA: SCO family protein [Fimbriimonadaceae bacterium]|nr:SCO family protein [Fimbriimonadaceae bacterium]